jgi:Uma2 family endonuclease
MNATVTTSRMPYDGWTTDDLDALAPDGLRRELVDGVLIVTPFPVYSHQNAASMLFTILLATCPPSLRPVNGVEIRINHKKCLIPDLMIVRSDGLGRNPKIFRPDEVVLAVEIVSPTTVSIDRVLKPSLYASAGIPNYWRIEPTEDFRLHAYALAGDVYAEAGEFDTQVSLKQPWPMEFTLTDIKHA